MVDEKYIYGRWREFPELVEYGESGMLLHLDKSCMNYVSEGGGFKISAEVYLQNGKLFKDIGRKKYRHKVALVFKPYIHDWLIGKKPNI